MTTHQDDDANLPQKEEEEVLVGPAMPAPKKRKILQFEEQYLERLPLSNMYEKSYMHKDWVTHVVVAKQPEFVITESIDGVVKFWKKQKTGIEFAKQFKSHLQRIVDLVVSHDGSLCASVSLDKTVKIFDVATFDMIAIVKLEYFPGKACWAYTKKSAKQYLAVSNSENGKVYVYDVRENTSEGWVEFHGVPVTAMVYQEEYDAVISCDQKGN